MFKDNTEHQKQAKHSKGNIKNIQVKVSVIIKRKLNMDFVASTH